MSNEVTNSNSNSSTGDAWSLSIKPVGAEHSSSETPGGTGTRGGGGGLPSKDFTIEVSPDDDLASLYEQIEGVTGLKASQQRLIYRGQLIGRSTYGQEDKESKAEHGQGAEVKELKIKDIRGLSNGQTIHLVKKRDHPQDEESSGDGRRPATPGAIEASSDSDESEVLGASGAAPLLAALLGLGGDDDRGSEMSRRLRSGRLGTARRRFNHRLTAEDLEVPDPGSMESVRQGMMTLHTLIPHAQSVASLSRSGQSRSPLEANRRWYIGQWIDCLDTVNQWLEATIIEIVVPDDILPPRAQPMKTPIPAGAPRSSPADPVVTATDFEGRRMLLLERCEEGDADDEGGELEGFRRRDNDDDVQLLLVHYNGWPHRWDEWIRSDSDRIRPFRVRTRHPSGSAQASPTPQSVYSESPPTMIRNRDEVADRVALLPELGRVMTSVNELLGAAAIGVASRSAQSLREGSSEVDNPNLPWMGGSGCGGVAVGSMGGSAPSPASGSSACLRTELEALAPLLDRLGRTLVDAAPQVSALSRSLSTINRSEPEQRPTEPVEEHPTSLGGLLSLLGRDRRRQSNASNNVVVPNDSHSVQGSVQTGVASEDTSSIDPDLSDFAYGVVNTTRGEVRRGPRSRGASDDAAGLLGAYLAAASLSSLANSSGDNEDEDGNLQGLSRILRERGNGGGIDIHIHAVVTAPGLPTGGLGLTAIGGAGIGTGGATGNLLTAADTAGVLFSGRSSSRASQRRDNTRPPPVVHDDDEGIFSELYSETPDPVDPSRSPSPDNGVQNPRVGRSEAMSAHPPRTPSRANSSTLSSNRSGSARQSDGMERSNSRRGGVLGRFFRRNPSTDGE